MPSIEKDLTDLRDEWESCTKCELGVRREAVGGEFVFGEGVEGGIMLIGEGPGKVEEEEGKPFIGPSGQKVLRPILEHLKMHDCYITNVVACRSCSEVTDAMGQPLMHGGQPSFKDEPPTKAQMDACLPRLWEEIYLVDPIVIVSLGAKAAEALSKGHISITKERGLTREIEVPGNWRAPVLTAKKQVWVRKEKGVLRCPTVQNMVRYILVPTLHPAYVLRKFSDKGPKSPLRVFGEDLSTAKRIRDFILEESRNGNNTEATPNNE